MHCMMSILKCYWFFIDTFLFFGELYIYLLHVMAWCPLKGHRGSWKKIWESNKREKLHRWEAQKVSKCLYLKAYLKEPGVTQRWTGVIPRAQAIVWSSIGTDSAAETVEAVEISKFNLQYSCLMLTRLFETSAKVLQSTGSDSALQDKLAVKTFSKQDIWRHSCKEITSGPKTLHPMLILARLNM